MRASNFNINKCDFLKAKEIDGNIIPAIASTTAAITNIRCIKIYTVLQNVDLNCLRSGAINLGISEFDLFIPEEKRYIKDFPQNENNPEYKVIPKEFTVWDKIDFNGPNMTIKSLVYYFKNKYNVDIDYINYNKNIVLASPIDGEKDFFKKIKILVEEKAKIKIHEGMKYIK